MTRGAPSHPTRDPVARIGESLVLVAAAVLVLAVPLVWNTNALDPFRGPKSALALGAWAALAALFVAGNWRSSAWRDPWWAPWGGVVAGGALSAVASGHAARVLASVLPLLLAALGWGSLRQLSEARRGRVARLVLWAAFLEAVAVLAFVNPPWQPTSFADLTVEGGRYAFIGTLGNPADVAVFLLLPAVLAAERALTQRRSRLVYASLALLLAGILVATRTLTAIAALAAGLIVLAWFTVERRHLVPVLASGVALLGVVTVATPIRSRVVQAVRDMRVAGGIWIGSGRAAGWAAAGSMLAARPLTGVGFDQFEANSFRFQSLTALAARAQVLGLRTGFGETHDDILQYAAETGLTGVVLAAAGLAYAWRRRAPAGTTIAGAAPLAGAALVIAVTQFPLHLAAVAAQWTVLAALVLPALPPTPATTGRAAWLRLAAALCVTAAAAFVAWERFEAGVATGEARRLAGTLRVGSLAAATRTQIARAALGHLVSPLGWLFDSWQARLVVGNLAAEAGDTKLEFESFAAALAMVERPEVQFDVGMALLRAGQRDDGLAHLERAVQLNPAIFREVRDADLSRALRRRLDASGYGAKQAWMYAGTPAATQ